MIRVLFFVLIFCYSINVDGQVVIENKTGKTITNAYIIEYDSTLRTEGFCAFIKNKNLVKAANKSKTQIPIKINLNPSKYYNLVCFDTAGYHNYNGLIIKYYFSGKTKRLTLITSDVESDFFGHCEDGLADRNNKDYLIDITNNTKGALIKLYYKFNADEDFKRDNNFYQWQPVKKEETRKMELYNKVPITADKMYVKCVIESKGIITEYNSIIDLKENPDWVKLAIE